jgi:hypothetical protein
MAEAVLLQEPGEREIGRGAGPRGRHRLALHVLDRGDGVAHDHAVGAVRLVHLKELRGGDAIGIPHDPGLDRGRRTLDVAGGDREMAAPLRNLLERDVEAVLGEDAGLLGEDERRKSGPARDTDGDLGALRERRPRKQGCCDRNRDHPDHVLLRLEKRILWRVHN